MRAGNTTKTAVGACVSHCQTHHLMICVPSACHPSVCLPPTCCVPTLTTTAHTCRFSPSLPRYDKVKIVLKEITNCQFCACMNPTAGSFNITPRMQRQFMTLAVQMPPPEIVRSVYFQVGAVQRGGFAV